MRNLPILGRKDELAERILKMINHGLSKYDEDGHAAMAVVTDTMNTQKGAEGEASDAENGEGNAKDCFDNSFFKFLYGISTPTQRPQFSTGANIRSVQSPPADIYISFERLAKSVLELRSYAMHLQGRRRR